MRHLRLFAKNSICKWQKVLVFTVREFCLQVPLKRVNQAYVIATSTKVEVGSADLSKFDDAYFKPTEKKVKKKGEKEFFETEETEKKVSILSIHPGQRLLWPMKLFSFVSIHNVHIKAQMYPILSGGEYNTHCQLSILRFTQPLLSVYFYDWSLDPFSLLVMANSQKLETCKMHCSASFSPDVPLKMAQCLPVKILYVGFQLVCG